MKIGTLLLALALLLASSASHSEAAGTLYTVTSNIQTQCLDRVAAGDSCRIDAGTYNQALVIKTSGASGAPITLIANGVVTVNSGASDTLDTSGHQSWYIFDGLRFISTRTGGEGVYTINLTKGWTTGKGLNQPGNTHIVFRNCYIEGAIVFYGSNNLIDNCEINGAKRLHDGVRFEFAASADNILQNSSIHSFTGRAVWSSGETTGTVVQGNSIYDSQFGVDCDGAGVPVRRCNVLSNTIHAMNAASFNSGIFLENSFDGLVDGNSLYDISGPGMYIINYGDGPTWHTDNNIEYRNVDSNTVVSNNSFLDGNNKTILLISANGYQFIGNAANGTQTINRMVWLEVEPTTSFYPHNEIFHDNVLNDPNASFAVYMDSDRSMVGSDFQGNTYGAKNAFWIGGTSYTLSQFRAAFPGQENTGSTPTLPPATRTPTATPAATPAFECLLFPAHNQVVCLP